MASAQNLYVGSNTSGNITNFTSGTNSYSNTYVGYTSDATNNLLTVSGAGTVLTNTNYLFVGYAGSGNRLIISNGGQVNSGMGRLGRWSTSSNNSVLVTGTNSRWTLQNYLQVGNDDGEGDANSLVISNGGQVIATNPYYSSVVSSSSNSFLVTGVGSLLDVFAWRFGYFNESGNSLVISNGAIFSVRGSSYIGNFNSSNNSILVTGTGSLFTNNASIFIGLNSSSANRMVISNGGTVISRDVTIGSGGRPDSVDPTSVLVTGTNSRLIATNSLTVGFQSDNNRLTVADGGSVSVGQDLIINQFYPNNDGFDQAGSLVLVQSGRLSVTNGKISFGAGLGTLQVDGGTVEVYSLLATTPITPSAQVFPAERRGSYVLLNGGTINSYSTMMSNQIGLSDNLPFSIGGSTGSGATFIANKTGSFGGVHRFWADMIVGDAGSSNSLVITNGAVVYLLSRLDTNSGPSGGTNLVIGVAAGSSNNSVSISSGRLAVTNGTIEVGRSGSGALNVSGGGTVAASNIVIATANGSSGTLNIGRFGTNDTAGTISTPTITFGSGTGAVNFNQSNALVFTSAISGAGTVRQLGSGTTTLSASNTYTGGTTISAGTLEMDNTGSVAGNITNNATLSINRTNTLTLTNLVSGTGALSKSGTGTLVLAATNTYSGNTTISAGTLQINAGGSVSNSATTLVGSGGAGTLSISGGTYSNTSVSIGYNGGTGILNLNSGSLSAQNLAVSGNGAAAGTLNLNGGTMAVSGSFYVASGGTINVNTGGVLRGGNGGHLSVGSTNSLINFNGGTGSSGLNLFVGNGGTVDLRGQSLGSNNWGNLIASAPGGLLRNSSTNAATIANQNTIWIWQEGQKLTIDASGGDILINSWITSSLMTNTGIIKTGTNALVLSNSGNDYNGGTFLQQGTLRLDNAQAAGSGSITQSDASSTLQINATGTVINAMSLYNIATLQTVTLSGNKILNGTTYNVAAATMTTDSGVLSGTGGLTKSGAGTLTLGGTNTYSGGTRVIGGTLALGATNTLADVGAVTVTGSSSVLTNSNNQFVGNMSSSNSLIISNGGTVANFRGYIGFSTNSSSNSVIVTGSNSLWTNRTSLYVGQNGSGNSMVISDGGKVANGVGFVGNLSTASNNSALVTGTNSLWSNNNDLFIGYSHTGNSLIISNGGTVTSPQSSIGESSTSFNNSALVTGRGSLWTNSTYITVGSSGSGNILTIGNGGWVASSSGYIGRFSSSSNNSAIVTGVSSLWTNSGALTVGEEGTSNSLTVAAGGTVAAASISIAASNGSSATLNIGRFDANDAAGTIIAPTIVFGAGRGAINFNQTNAFTLASAISGNGSVNQLGSGMTILTGTNSHTGTTSVSRGALSLGSTGNLSAAAHVQVTGGTLLLGGNNQINTNAALTMGTAGSSTPATLSMGASGSTRAAAQTFATLTLTGNSVIDFANLTGTSSLTFGNISGLSSNSLAIWNWSSSDGYATSLYDADAGLSTGDLANISFYSGSGTGFIGTGSFTGSEIVPVPEPSVIIATLLLLVWLFFSNRRTLSILSARLYHALHR